jgi:hypothetical protein
MLRKYKKSSMHIRKSPFMIAFHMLKFRYIIMRKPINGQLIVKKMKMNLPMKKNNLARNMRKFTKKELV